MNPAPFTAHATVRRGTFTAEVLADGQNPGEAFAIVNSLLKQMKLKAPRGKKWQHLAPVVEISLHSRVDVLEDAAERQAQHAAHVEELKTYAHGLHYQLEPGTPELFTAPASVTETKPETTQATHAEPKPRKPRRSRRYNGVTQAQAFTGGLHA